jgi:uncharacterized protein YndB with AHSA1/START domain
MQRVERSVLLPAPEAEVWASLTDADLVSRWFGSEVVVLEARRHGRVVMRDDAGIRRGVIEDFVEGRRLLIRWLPIIETDSGLRDTPSTEVEFRLEEEGGGTRLTVTERRSSFGAVEDRWRSAMAT